MDSYIHSDISNPSIDDLCESKTQKENFFLLKDLWETNKIDNFFDYHSLSSSMDEEGYKVIHNDSEVTIKGSKTPFYFHHSEHIKTIYVDTREGNITILLGPPFSIGKKLTIKDITGFHINKQNNFKTTIQLHNAKNFILESNVSIKNTVVIPSNGSSVTLKFSFIDESYVWIIYKAIYTPSKNYFFPNGMYTYENEKKNYRSNHKIKMVSSDMYQEISKKTYQQTIK